MAPGTRRGERGRKSGWCDWLKLNSSLFLANQTIWLDISVRSSAINTLFDITYFILYSMILSLTVWLDAYCRVGWNVYYAGHVSRSLLFLTSDVNWLEHNRRTSGTFSMHIDEWCPLGITSVWFYQFQSF
jgi:hypothetical protein